MPIATGNTENGYEMAALMVCSVASDAVAKEKTIVGVVKVVRERRMVLLLIITILVLLIRLPLILFGVGIFGGRFRLTIFRLSFVPTTLLGIFLFIALVVLAIAAVALVGFILGLVLEDPRGGKEGIRVTVIYSTAADAANNRLQIDGRIVRVRIFIGRGGFLLGGRLGAFGRF